ncbi:MAG: sigma-70 family RNA polymerase sigma factor [Clostridiaceae bacterium]|nr:sigma-70 family RNA polymerase sigma factor [Clostridiaceae bacterium]
MTPPEQLFAFETLVAAHGKAVYNYLRLKLPGIHDAQDVLQETLLAAWRGFDAYRAQAAPRTWLLAIARHKCADFFRRAYGHPTEPLPSDDGLPYSDEEQTLDRIAVGDALESLSGADRELVYILYRAGLTYAEAADVLGVPEGTIKSRVAALKAKLRAKLA